MEVVASEASSLYEARKLLARESFDFVILDAVMQDTAGPDADGLNMSDHDLLREIKSGKYGGLEYCSSRPWAIVPPQRCRLTVG